MGILAKEKNFKNSPKSDLRSCLIIFTRKRMLYLLERNVPRSTLFTSGKKVPRWRACCASSFFWRRERERETKEEARRQGSDYPVQQVGLARATEGPPRAISKGQESRGGTPTPRPFTCVCTRWMVNVKPRVSLAWPPRSLDHNALSSLSQADHDHGDPTTLLLPPPSPPPLSYFLSFFLPTQEPLRTRAWAYSRTENSPFTSFLIV